MNITVSVIDGVSGHPAEGVEVTVIGRPVGGPAGSQQPFLAGLTDANGDFTYSPEGKQLSKGEYYTVELDVDKYFASLGMMAGYKQVTILVRIVNTQTDHRIVTLIAPFSHATWTVR